MVPSIDQMSSVLNIIIRKYPSVFELSYLCCCILLHWKSSPLCLGLLKTFTQNWESKGKSLGLCRDYSLNHIFLSDRTFFVFQGSKLKLSASVWKRISWNLTKLNLIRQLIEKMKITIVWHSVLEGIWVKGSYLSQWLPQGERGPPKESKSQWIKIFHGGSH